MKKRLQVNGLLMFLAVCFILFFPKSFLRLDSEGAVNSISEVFGFAFILFGLLLRVSARGYKIENSKQGYSLVRGGPYKLVRNPMYLGIAMIGLGMVLLLFRWWAIFVFFVIFAARYILLIFKEEKKLIAQFGQVYIDYMQSTPRILPRIDSILRQDIRELLPLRLSWVKRDMGVVICFVFLTLGVESWEDVLSSGLKGFTEEFLGFLFLMGLFLLLAVYLSASGKRRK